MNTASTPSTPDSTRPTPSNPAGDPLFPTCPAAFAAALCPDPHCPIETFTATLVQRYRAEGELEIMFCRHIASAGITWRSIQNSIDRLNHTNDPEGRIIDRLTKAQSRALRMGILALKELKGLQERRNLLVRFPDQTKDCPPLADHTPFVGALPKIKPIPQSLRGHLQPPTGAKPNPTGHKSPLNDGFDKLDTLLNTL